MSSPDRPRVVCLCGSLRFEGLFRAERRRLTAEGVIVLGPEAVDGEPTLDGLSALAELHLRRIDLADEVRVVSEGGYLGTATRHEIEYARSRGKALSSIEPGLDLRPPEKRRSEETGCSDRNAGILEELLALEPLTHRHPPGADRTMIGAHLDEGFVEIGASGRSYHREHVLDVVEERYALGIDPDDAAWSVRDASVLVVAEGLYLLTYDLEHEGRPSRRSTLWRRDGAAWRALHHQGTLRETPPGR